MPISFKQFISEAIVKKWEISGTSYADGIRLLNTHCSKGLDAIKNGGLIYRGFTYGVPDDDIIVMDSSNSKRTSRDSNNIYQMMMDNAKALQHLPSRSSSFICSTGKNTAARYGKGNGTALVMFPFDGTDLAVTDVWDIYVLDTNKELFPWKLDRLDLFARIAVKLGAKMPGGDGDPAKFTDMQSFDKAFSTVTSEELTVLTGLTVSGISSLEFSEEADPHMRIILNSSDSKKLSAKELTSLRILADEFKNLKIADHYSEVENFYKLMKSAPVEKRFTSLSNAIMASVAGKIKIQKFGESMPVDKECWFSGKAIGIPFTIFADILNNLQDQKFPIDSSIFEQWKYEMQGARNNK